MPIIPETILKLCTPRLGFAWSEMDAIRYALGVGFGHDPLDENELAFVYERDLKVVPTLATVAAWGIGPDRGLMGIDQTQMVHAQQSVVLHQTLPPAAQITADARVTGLYDKGEKGALIVVETRLFDAAGAALATMESTIFARADGGFGGQRDAPAPHAVPGRPADRTVAVATRPDQALLFRLNGDLNPLHVDPAAAAAAGFPRPILHGLSTYGATCKAVLGAYAGWRSSAIASHAVRFTGPVYPGETLTIELWRDEDVVSFRAHVAERSARVIDNGRTVLR